MENHGKRTMKSQIRTARKAYAMMRMIQAIGRAIESTSDADKDRAARWAAAWGVINGIRSPGIRLKRSVLSDSRSGKPPAKSRPPSP